MLGESRKDFVVRNTRPSDHQRIMDVMIAWWNGRDLRAMLPKLFLIHFNNTSFVSEINEQLAGFLVGFLSPSLNEEGYVHFMGIGPDFRKNGLGSLLYNRFFDICRQNGRSIVRACTSPVNRDSIAFHRKIGFILEPGDGEVDGIPFTSDYNRPGDDKVLFTKYL